MMMMMIMMMMIFFKMIQRRMDGSVNFYRGWTEYKKGFGDINTEFWIGIGGFFLKQTLLYPMAYTLNLNVTVYGAVWSHKAWIRLAVYAPWKKRGHIVLHLFIFSAQYMLNPIFRQLSDLVHMFQSQATSICTNVYHSLSVDTFAWIDWIDRVLRRIGNISWI